MREPLDYHRTPTPEPSEWDQIPLWLLLLVTGPLAGIVGFFVYGLLQVRAA